MKAMGNVITGRTKDDDFTVKRDKAIKNVRTIWRGVQVVEGLACRRMMDLGDVLFPIRQAAGYGGWGAFLRDCEVPKRDAQIAIQLAKARSEIEAENTKRASLSQQRLSIRAALELIRVKKAAPSTPGGKKIVITVDAVITWLKTATAEDKRRVACALAQELELDSDIGTETAAA